MDHHDSGETGIKTEAQGATAAGERRPVMQLISYSEEELTEVEITDLDEIGRHLGKLPVTWLNVDSVTDHAVVAKIGEIFELHPLALEDVIHLNQRAKVEEYGRNEFIVATMVSLGDTLQTEQLSLFLGEGFVVTFQEDRPGDSFAGVRERLRRSRGRIRGEGPDYLTYALLDAVVDGYFPVLEAYGERLEDLQDDILRSASKHSIAQIHKVKRELLTLRRAIWPLRDALNSLYRDSVSLIKSDTRVYLRDCHDHAIRIIDLLEVDRELCSDLMDVYLSSVSNRLNEVIKVLTIITTILLPPSFIAAVYGMNFNTDRSPWNMPELNWYFGYEFAWLLMAGSIVIGVVLWVLWERGKVNRVLPLVGRKRSGGARGGAKGKTDG